MNLRNLHQKKVMVLRAANLLSEKWSIRSTHYTAAQIKNYLKRTTFIRPEGF